MWFSISSRIRRSGSPPIRRYFLSYLFLYFSPTHNVLPCLLYMIMKSKYLHYDLWSFSVLIIICFLKLSIFLSIFKFKPFYLLYPFSVVTLFPIVYLTILYFHHCCVNSFLFIHCLDSLFYLPHLIPIHYIISIIFSSVILISIWVCLFHSDFAIFLFFCSNISPFYQSRPGNHLLAHFLGFLCITYLLYYLSNYINSSHILPSSILILLPFMFMDHWLQAICDKLYSRKYSYFFTQMHRINPDSIRKDNGTFCQLYHATLQDTMYLLFILSYLVLYLFASSRF